MVPLPGQCAVSLQFRYILPGYESCRLARYDVAYLESIMSCCATHQPLDDARNTLCRSLRNFPLVSLSQRQLRYAGIGDSFRAMERLCVVRVFGLWPKDGR